jgi:hypothetical protein
MKIIIKYTQQKGNICSNLTIYSNGKQIGTTFYGNDADLMFKILSRADYSNVGNDIDEIEIVK